MIREEPSSNRSQNVAKHQTELQQRITKLKQQYPDRVVVYFTRHKSAPQTLPKPKTPLMLFPRQLKIEQVFYALYQQIQVKGLSYYVLKAQGNNMVIHFNIKTGQTLGQVYDAYSYNNYLALIYTQGALKKGKFSYLKKKVIRIIVLAGMIYLMLQIFEYFQNFFSGTSNPSQISMDQT